MYSTHADTCNVTLTCRHASRCNCVVSDKQLRANLNDVHRLLVMDDGFKHIHSGAAAARQVAGDVPDCGEAG